MKYYKWCVAINQNVFQHQMVNQIDGQLPYVKEIQYLNGNDCF